MKIILETMEDIEDFKELLGVAQVSETEVKTEPVTKKKATKKEEKVQAPKEEVKDEEEEEVKEEPKTEKVEAENVGVDEAPTDTKDTEVKTVTKEDVQNVCKVKIKAGKSTEVKEIIKAHGATKISDIKEEDYEKIVAELGVL